jgi:hypothetical protein
MRVLISCCVLAGLLTGCQATAPLAAKQLAAQQSSLDLTGLTAAQIVEALKVRAAPPQKWEAIPMRKTALYTHEQWRSPSRLTGIGVAYVHLPIPLPIGTLLWFAKAEYSKHDSNGQLLNQWTDSIGRRWFEGENKLYHCKGYILVNGTDAWFVYYGYKLTKPSDPTELNLAARAMDTIIPQTRAAAEAEMQANSGAAPSLVR